MLSRAGLWLAPAGLLIAWSCSSTPHKFAAGAGAPGESAGGEGGAGDSRGEAGEGGSVSPTNSRDDGGAAGDAAGAELTVQATTPNDGASAVERDVAIEVSFSAALDPKTITSDAFSVVGPTGIVSGRLSVSGAKVTFTPSAAWSLFADYTVSLASTIRSAQGVPLSSADSFAFQTRDGVFRKPERLTTMNAVNLQVVGSRAGHVGVVWTDYLMPASTFAVVFDPQSTKWGTAAAVASDAQISFISASVAFNDLGQAFAVAGSNTLMWNRFDGSAWGTARSVPAGHFSSGPCAIADDGTAMTFWREYVGEESRVFAQSLSPDDKWSAVATVRSGANLVGLKRFGSGFLALHQLEADKTLYSSSYDPKRGWLPEKLVTPSAGTFTQGMATTETAALLLWWDATNVATAALFDGTSWTNENLGPVTGGTHASVGERGHVAAWVNQNNAYAARYDLKLGWQAPSKLGAITAEYTGPGLEIDASGNALAAWPNGSSVSWRRAAHSSSGWGEPQQIKDQDPAEAVYSSVNSSSGEVMLVWANPLGVWASRFE